MSGEGRKKEVPTRYPFRHEKYGELESFTAFQLVVGREGRSPGSYQSPGDWRVLLKWERGWGLLRPVAVAEIRVWAYNHPQIDYPGFSVWLQREEGRVVMFSVYGTWRIGRGRSWSRVRSYHTLPAPLYDVPPVRYIDEARILE